MEDETETGVTKQPQIDKEAGLTTNNNHFDTTQQSKATDITCERLLVHLDRAISFAVVTDFSLATMLNKARVAAYALNTRTQSNLHPFDISGSYLDLAQNLASALVFALDPDRLHLSNVRFNLGQSFKRPSDRDQATAYKLAQDLRRDLAIDKARALDRARALNRAIIRILVRTADTHDAIDTHIHVSYLILQGVIILITLSINEDGKQGSATEKTN